MSVVLELDPEVEQALSTRAAAAGITISKYLEQIVTREVQLVPIKARHKAKNLMELGAPIRALGEDGGLDLRFEPF